MGEHEPERIMQQAWGGKLSRRDQEIIGRDEVWTEQKDVWT